MVHIHTEHSHETVRLTLQGELDLADAPQLDRELRAAEASGGHIIVDLAGVEFMDCSALRTLLAAKSHCRQNGCELSLVRIPPEVERIFEMTHTTHQLESDD
jgi:anti-anti-sigma factor